MVALLVFIGVYRCLWLFIRFVVCVSLLLIGNWLVVRLAFSCFIAVYGWLCVSAGLCIGCLLVSDRLFYGSVIGVYRFYGCLLVSYSVFIGCLLVTDMVYPVFIGF